MNMSKIHLLVSCLFFSCIHVNANVVAPVKPSPDVSFEKVQAVFGQNVYPTQTHLKLLLLAIAMDHTSTASPFKQYKIGIPYIAETGAGHWVKRLANRDYALDVIVNNALILLFSKEDIPNRKAGAIKLMQLAEKESYWPASFYLAEIQLADQLSIDYSVPSPMTGKISNGALHKQAKEAISRYNTCSEIGFSPCQFRIGFWLASSSDSFKNGLTVVRTAINTTLSDPRYTDTLDSLIVNGAALILENRAQINLSQKEADNYIKLIKQINKNSIAESK